MRGDRPTRQVSYGLGRRGLKSRTFERRSKRGFRRWLRRQRQVRVIDEVEMLSDTSFIVTREHDEWRRLP